MWAPPWVSETPAWPLCFTLATLTQRQEGAQEPRAALEGGHTASWIQPHAKGVGEGVPQLCSVPPSHSALGPSLAEHPRGQRESVEYSHRDQGAGRMEEWKEALEGLVPHNPSPWPSALAFLPPPDDTHAVSSQ